MMKGFSIFVGGVILVLFGVMTVSSVLPPSSSLDEVQQLIARLHQDESRLAEALKNLQEDERKLQEYLAATAVGDPRKKTDVK